MSYNSIGSFLIIIIFDKYFGLVLLVNIVMNIENLI